MESSSGKQNSLLEGLTPEDADILKNQTSQEKKEIYIFLSFDLVGSTKLKTEQKTSESWPDIILKFYEMVKSEMENKIPQISVWKYLGDEVLLYVSIEDMNSDSVVYSMPQTVFDVQKKISEDIKDVFKNYELSDLFIKSTIWIAGVKSVESKKINTEECSNLPSDKVYGNRKITLGRGNLTDFVGPDMDIGFRIAKFAYKKKVVISANFAYLLYSMSKPKGMKKIDNSMKIVSFEILKGVWNGGYYPIIWYYTDWKCVEDSFFYSDYKENELVDNVLAKKICHIGILEQVWNKLKKTEVMDNFVEECVKKISLKTKKIQK